MKKLTLILLLLPFLAKAQSEWKYFRTVDEMTSKVNTVAYVESSKKIDFPFPYNGGATATLSIQYNDKTPNVFLSLDKGQINDTGEQIVKIQVKFDTDAPKTYNCFLPTSGNYKLLSFLEEKKFINKLLTAQFILVQVSFYEAGAVNIPFVVAGLDATKLK